MPTKAASNSKSNKLRAVAYVRMSTDHQQYSTQNQLDVIKKYASEHSINIIRTYSDDGKSGLNIRNRHSFGELIKLVESGSADFEAILVYDVSRWGRFQDTDESSHYEWVCKTAGIKIHFCAEQFDNDGTPISTVVKNLKQVMAGEYIRELSQKVFQGACRLIELGYRQGGAAGYGLRRMRVDVSGQRKGILGRGEHKSIQTDRVILVPGPDEEVETVRWIYNRFINDEKSESEIAAELNQRGIKTDLGRDWTRGVVHQILTNEKYIGNNVYHRTAYKLKEKRVVNPTEDWVKKEGAFAAIVDREVFYTAHGIILARCRKISDEEMLDRLRQLRDRQGRLSGIIIDESSDLPSSSAYSHRFGSLIRAYELIGYDPGIDYTYIEINKYLRRKHPEVMDHILNELRTTGASIQLDEHDGIYWINGEYRFSLVLSRCLSTTTGQARWNIRLDEGLAPDFTIVARMAPDNKSIQDYYVLPSIDMEQSKLRMAEHNGLSLDIYRHDNLSVFFELSKRVQLEDVA